MKSAETDAFLACTDDNDFRKKFAIAAVCAIGSAIIVPGILLLGYLAKTMKRAGMGRKGLPEWTNLGELAALGGVSLLSLLYLLPSALLVVLSMVPNARSFFSFSALISRFIWCGALAAYVVGVAFAVTAIHAYLKTGKISDLFQIGALQKAIFAHKSELSSLVAIAAAAVVVTGAFNWMLGWLGFPLGVLCSTFVSLVVFYNAGKALGPTEPEPISAEKSLSAQAAKALEAPEAESSEPETPEAPPSEDTWVPN